MQVSYREMKKTSFIFNLIGWGDKIIPVCDLYLSLTVLFMYLFKAFRKIVGGRRKLCWFRAQVHWRAHLICDGKKFTQPQTDFGASLRYGSILCILQRSGKSLSLLLLDHSTYLADSKLKILKTRRTLTSTKVDLVWTVTYLHNPYLKLMKIGSICACKGQDEDHAWLERDSWGPSIP